MGIEDEGSARENVEAEAVPDNLATKGPKATSTTAAPQDIPAEKFSPYDLTTAPRIPSGLPPEIWTIVQSGPAAFPPQYFLEVNRNLLENPNLTASHLSRAELSYQSFTDATFNPKAETPVDLASIIKHLRPECQPRLVQGGVEGYDLEWTVVRKLIPRNPNLDDSMMQTCHLYTSKQDITITATDGAEETVKAERYLVVYIPHADGPEGVPYYHPTVRSLGMLYTYLPTPDSSSMLPAPGSLSIYFDFFPSHPQDNRLTRTALKLLEIIHKHSKGRHAGYKKRVHHDVIISQKRFQDTYAYLKVKYAKTLIEGWIEQTPPEKHVFEDLGIAAFLIELWKDMYATNKDQAAKDTFPGFVDIGCGNGLLVYILNAEGWAGWGFDARRRKTWATFGDEYVDKLKEMLLIPSVLSPTVSSSDASDTAALLNNAPPSHTGIFPPATFIISNHADELTPWTPLLAYLSNSPFIAIPCCSHDLGGTRFRAPVHKKYVTEDPNATSKEKNKQPSAYAGLCSWVSHLTEEMGYKVEKEHLRIPSTRNIAILGRGGVGDNAGDLSLEGRLRVAGEVVEKEMGGDTTLEQVRLMWMRSGGELVKPGKGGH
jgi:tRNASer (uridine44-2'-O)-methyltransferase